MLTSFTQKKFTYLIFAIASISWMLIGSVTLMGVFTVEGITDMERLSGFSHIMGGMILFGIVEVLDRIQELLNKINGIK